MSKYRMEDGTIIDTDNAKQSWEEATDFDGSNQISRATGSQWAHETLRESRKGRFYVEHWSNYQGSRPHAEWISEEAAVRWLLLNDNDVPERLAHLVTDVSE